MDDIDIILTCCLYSTKYKNLKDLNGKTKCPICNGDLYVQECLNKANNSFTIKKKEIEIGMESLCEFKKIFNDPRNIIHESYERIITDIDLRRELLKSNLCMKIDENASKLIKSLESKKKEHEESFKSLLADLETLEVKSIMDQIDSFEKFCDKTQFLEKELEIVNNYIDRKDHLLYEIKSGKKLRMIFDDDIDVEDMFGKITLDKDEKFSTKNEILSQEKKSLENQIQQMIKEKNTMEEKMRKFTQENTNLEDKVKKLTNDYKILERKMKNFTQEYNILKQNKTHIEEELKNDRKIRNEVLGYFTSFISLKLFGHYGSFSSNKTKLEQLLIDLNNDRIDLKQFLNSSKVFLS